ILRGRKDTVTLSVLLRVNSYYCSVTLPYLYGRALESSLVFTSNRGVMVRSDHIKLLQTLLRQRPRELVSDLLNAAYDVYPEQPDETMANSNSDQVMESETLANQTKIDYLCFVRTFIFESVVYMPVSGFGGVATQSNDYPSRLSDHTFRSKTGDAVGEYGDGLRDDHLLFPPMFKVGHTKGAADFRYGALTGALRRDLTWTICSSVFEQVQSLAIPLSDMDRYLDSVERFHSLRSVTFIMDEMLDLRGFGYHVLEARLDQEQCLERRNQQFRSMFTFMQRHTALFPNQIQSADCPVERSWRRSTICPEEVMNELKDSLPVMVNPVSINNHNWQQITRKFKSTNLDSVKEIAILGMQARNCMKTFLASQPTFLSRCRALASLKLNSPGPGSFKWAVKEKLAWEQFGVTTLTIAGDDPLPKSTMPAPEPLLPLQRVDIAVNGKFTDEIDDIAFAFGNTLLELCAISFVANGASEGSNEFRAGIAWMLPRIQKLNLAIQHQRLLIDRDLYAIGLGDQIESLELQDRSLDYRYQDVYTCRPAHTTLPALKKVALLGWPALTFHPDTLHRVPNLESLHLGFSNHFMPPVQELLASFQPMEERAFETTKEDGVVDQDGCKGSNDVDDSEGSLSQSAMLPHYADQRRPRRTWDWYLPKLQSLNLTSEWAYMFEFRMLEGCPSLQYLSLNIFTDDVTTGNEGRAYERRLTTHDFVRPGLCSALKSPNDQDQEQEEFGKSKFLVAPAIQTVRLFGHWNVDDTTMRVMYGTTFSEATLVEESGVSGYTLQTWLSTLHGLPNLKKAFCGLQLDEQEHEETMCAHGLVSRPITSSAPEKVFIFEDAIAHWSFAKDMEK
ncbi:hypothetical protein BGZ83_008510, partial [Gryganskiella cystojenkinii]